MHDAGPNRPSSRTACWNMSETWPARPAERVAGSNHKVDEGLKSLQIQCLPFRGTCVTVLQRLRRTGAQSCESTGDPASLKTFTRPIV